MIGEIIPIHYDVYGKPVSRMTRRQVRFFNRTYPMGRHVSQPLAHQCSTVEEVRDFLRQCKYVSDKKQFREEEFWLPPDEFEKVRRGDCDEFALWTWRQFIGMGYRARFVLGKAGKYKGGHAWVTIEKDGKNYIVEPQAWRCGETLPRLSLIDYEPSGSVEWDGKRLRYFMHQTPKAGLPLGLLLVLVGEWLLFWIKFHTGILRLEDFVKERVTANQAKHSLQHK